MPLYDFRCGGCGEVVESFISSWRNVQQEAPVCCGKRMTKVVSHPTIIHSHKIGGEVFPIDGVTLEHLPGGAKHFDSYKGLKKYAKDKDLQLGAIL